MSKEHEERRLSRQEWAKKMRREAYKRAKEQRASDPRYLAMKEEAKKRRHAAAQGAKERRKAASEKRKRDQMEKAAAGQLPDRVTGAARLKGMMRTASELERTGADSRPEPRSGQDRGGGSEPRS